jgi:hypothetical protein
MRRGSCALAATAALLVPAAAAQAEPTLSADTRSTDYAFTDARFMSGAGDRVVKSKIQLLGRTDRASVSDAGTDSATLIIEQTKCDAGVRRWRTYEARGVKGVAFDNLADVQSTLKGAIKLTGTESSASGCAATKPDAATARSLGAATVQVDSTWSNLQPTGDGSQLEPGPEPPPGSNDPPSLPPLEPPALDPQHACVQFLGGTTGTSSGWRGVFGGAEKLALYTPLVWGNLTPGGGAAQMGGFSSGNVKAGTDCGARQRAMRSRRRAR